jgi:hypothetical protein
MANYTMSDCLTFSLVLLFLLGALVAGPPSKKVQQTPILQFRATPEIEEVDDKVGIIEDFTFPGKMVGGVDKEMLELYNSF